MILPFLRATNEIACFLSEHLRRIRLLVDPKRPRGLGTLFAILAA